MKPDRSSYCVLYYKKGHIGTLQRFFHSFEKANDFAIARALDDDCSLVRLLENNEYYFESSSDDDLPDILKVRILKRS